MRKFEVVSEYQPSGDQPEAIARLAEGFLRGERISVFCVGYDDGKY